VVCRLVHEQFFRYAADQYVRAYPPSGPCLFEYGNSFPTFLADFEPCKHLPYLPDVARLEWALNCATHAEESSALDGSALLRLPTEDLPRLTLRLQPSLALLSSPWPIDQIWHVNQPGADSNALVDLASGGVYLEVRQSEDDSVFRALDPATHAFRDALSGGACLAEAADIAFEMDGVFDLPQALRNLFAEQLPLCFAVSVPSREYACRSGCSERFVRSYADRRRDGSARSGSLLPAPAFVPSGHSQRLPARRPTQARELGIHDRAVPGRVQGSL